MNKCKDCKHLGDEKQRSQVKLFRCKGIHLLQDCEEWNSDATANVLMKAHEQDLAFTQDASDYDASLYVREEFGCVMWEPR